MSAKDLGVLTGRDIPEMNLPGQPIVRAGGGEPLPIRAKCDASDQVGVASINEHLLACGEVPDPYGVVEAPGREFLAIWTESQAMNRLGMTLEDRGKVS